MKNEKPITNQREIELLNMTPTGREVLHSRGSPETWALSEDGNEAYLRDRRDVPHHEKLSVRLGRHLDRICDAAKPENGGAMNPAADEFMRRVDGGDLRSHLMKASYIRLSHDDDNGKILDVLLEEIGKLFSSAPPTLQQQLKQKLSEAVGRGTGN